jgi:hypothetical protein
LDKQNLIRIRGLDANTLSRREIIGETLLGLGSVWAIMGLGTHFIKIPSTIISVMMSVGVCAVVVILHELAHGVMFRIYTGKVKFGCKWKTKMGFVAYATSPGSILDKRKMVAVSLAPQVMSIAILATLPFIYNSNAWLSYCLLIFVAMNFGGGCADLHGVWLVMREKGKIFVEDTGTGMIIYRRNEV